MPRRLCSYVVALVVLLVPQSTRAQAPIELTFDPVVLPNDQSQVLTARFIGTLDQVDDAGKTLVPAGDFEMLADDSASEFDDRALMYIHHFYVRERSGGPFHLFRVKRRAIGAFADTKIRVRFSLRRGVKAGEGEVDFPIYSQSNEAIGLDLDPLTPVRLWLSSPQTVRLKLANHVPFSVTLIGAKVTADETLWAGTPEATLTCGGNKEAAHLLGPNESKPCLQIIFTPKLFQALTESVTPLGANKAHTSPTLDLGYELVPGVTRTATVVVPIVFRPTIWNLIIALVVGASIGMLVPLSGKVRHPPRVWLRRWVAALATAIVFEVGGLLLEISNTHVVVMSVPITPSQLLPALFVGMAAGLVGPRLIKKWTEDV